eukprot:scaffold101177_cov70-Phaeocystis_antarctica.AAC.2
MSHSTRSRQLARFKVSMFLVRELGAVVVRSRHAAERIERPHLARRVAHCDEAGHEDGHASAIRASLHEVAPHAVA